MFRLFSEPDKLQTVAKTNGLIGALPLNSICPSGRCYRKGVIFQCCPFDNENLIAGLSLKESVGYVGEMHISEANRTFRYTPKDFHFENELVDSRVRYHQINADSQFLGKHWRLTQRAPFLRYSVNPWVNESRQRNLACSQVKAGDQDIVVLSDIDEIIDRRYWPEVIWSARKHGIVTVGLHFTLYYFNLFSTSTLGDGPDDYSYKVFAMTGKVFNELHLSSDRLRKLGESGKLLNSVHRISGIQGFHHSWLGDSEFVRNKLLSYSHGRSDHVEELYSDDGSIRHEYLKYLLTNNISVFGNHTLRVSQDISQLSSVEALRKTELSRFFL